MAKTIDSYVRPDERQFIFIVEHDRCYTLVETAEMWEQPLHGPDGAHYHHYPTILDRQVFVSLESARSEALQRYPWIKGDQL